RDQDEEAQGTGRHSGGHGARLRQEPRRSANGHHGPEGSGPRRPAHLHELPLPVNVQNRKPRFPLALLWLLGLLAAGAFAPAAAARYAQGERVQITGIVADAQGQPLPEVRVTFEATRTYFSIRELRRTADKEIRRVSATTNASGEYTVVWPWDS